MPSRRRSRFEKLFRRDAERFVTEALKLRRTILDAALHLSVTGEQYQVLQEVHEALLKALPLVSGKPLNDRRSDFGLLPLDDLPEP
jgi:hypothetical protein